GKEMEDEKKRIEEERKKLEEEKKSKVAKITKVEFLDRENNAKRIFKTGDEIMVRTYFEINATEEVFNFGFALYDEKKTYLLGINSILDKINTKKYTENKYVQINLKNVPLRN